MWNITDGFISAVQVWSEYLTGRRGLDEWGTYGAQYFFAQEFNTVPKRPPTKEQLVALANLCGWLQNDADVSSPKMVKKFDDALGVAGDYLRDQLRVELVAGPPPARTSDLTLAKAAISAAMRGGVVDFPPVTLSSGGDYLSPDTPLNDVVDDAAKVTEYDKPSSELHVDGLLDHEFPEARVDGAL